MHPYRSIEVITEIKTKGKKRPFYKTLYWKLLILIKGKWKNRFTRCDWSGKYADPPEPRCLFVWKTHTGPYYDPTSFFHSLKHIKPRNPKWQGTDR